VAPSPIEVGIAPIFTIADRNVSNAPGPGTAYATAISLTAKSQASDSSAI